MEDDSMDIIVNGGLIFLFAFAVAQTHHQDRPDILWQDLLDSDLQVNPSSSRTKSQKTGSLYCPLVKLGFVAVR